MPTFNGQGLTTTGDDPNQPLNFGADSVIPDLGSLIVTGDGMSGKTPFNFVTINGGTITGVDCDLIHGDVFHEVVQASDSAVDKGNVTEEIEGDFSETVNGAYTETVTGLYTLTVTTGWSETQNGPVNRYYAQIVTDTFNDDHHIDQPDTAEFQVTSTQNTCIWGEQIQIVGIFQLQVVDAIALTVAALFDLEYKAWHAELHICHGELHPANLALKMVKAEADAAEATVKTQVAVRGSANCGVDVDCGFPPT